MHIRRHERCAGVCNPPSFSRYQASAPSHMLEVFGGSHVDEEAWLANEASQMHALGAVFIALL